MKKFKPTVHYEPRPLDIDCLRPDQQTKEEQIKAKSKLAKKAQENILADMIDVLIGRQSNSIHESDTITVYKDGSLYKVVADDKNKERLSLLKGGTIEECLEYIRSVYRGAEIEVKE